METVQRVRFEFDASDDNVVAPQAGDIAATCGHSLEGGTVTRLSKAVKLLIDSDGMPEMTEVSWAMFCSECSTLPRLNRAEMVVGTIEISGAFIDSSMAN
jgi:hypothetical protein